MDFKIKEYPEYLGNISKNQTPNPMNNNIIKSDYWKQRDEHFEKRNSEAVELLKEAKGFLFSEGHIKLYDKIKTFLSIK